MFWLRGWRLGEPEVNLRFHLHAKWWPCELVLQETTQRRPIVHRSRVHRTNAGRKRGIRLLLKELGLLQPDQQRALIKVSKRNTSVVQIHQDLDIVGRGEDESGVGKSIHPTPVHPRRGGCPKNPATVHPNQRDDCQWPYEGSNSRQVPPLDRANEHAVT